MSYYNPRTITYTLGLHDFGTAGEVIGLKGPSGLTGKVREILVSATETFNAVTTEGGVLVGSTDGGSEHAICALGTLADKATYRASAVSGAIRNVDIVADAAVYVSLVAPTGGTPAGMAHTSITIDWFKK